MRFKKRCGKRTGRAKRLKKENRRKRKRKALSEIQREYSKYVIVLTSLGEQEASTEHLLELYRMRRQIELTFKRLKSLFRYGGIPVKSDKSARAWFCCKLLLAALCETPVNNGRFSPVNKAAAGNGQGVRWSLRREQCLALSLVTNAVLSFGKRKRFPKLCLLKLTPMVPGPLLDV